MAHEDARLALVSTLTERFGAEVSVQRENAVIPWANIPTVRAMTVHLGNVHRWVASIVEHRAPMPETDTSPDGDLAGWYADGREVVLEVLRATEPDQPCWILGDRRGTVAFWRRRMVYENVKHLIDVRASDGRGWRTAPELSPSDYAGGIDELFSEFLPRSRPTLPRLPAAIRLIASDVDREWCISPDWSVSTDRRTGAPEHSASLTAHAGDLALLVWERAVPGDRSRFRRQGHPEALRTFADAVLHPW